MGSVEIQTRVLIGPAGIIAAETRSPIPKNKYAHRVCAVLVWTRIIAAVSGYLACLGFLMLSVGMVAYDKNFYDDQISKGTAESVGISNDDMQRLIDGWIAYFSGKEDSLDIKVSFDGEEPSPFYTDAELEHMADARVVFLAVQTWGWIFVTVAFSAMIGLLIARRDRRSTLAFCAIWGSFAFLTLGAVLAIIIAADFQAAFTTFHHIFFPQGNWQFNTPMTAILTSDLFMNAAMLIMIKGAAFSFTMFVGGLLLQFVKRRRRKHSPYAGHGGYTQPIRQVLNSNPPHLVHPSARHPARSPATRPPVKRRP